MTCLSFIRSKQLIMTINTADDDDDDDYVAEEEEKEKSR